MKTSFAIILLLLSLTSHINAQYFNVNPKDIQLAEKYIKKYEDEEYFSSVSEEKYSFSIDKINMTPRAEMKETVSIISLKELLKDYYKTIFFDETTEVNTIRAFDYKGKKIKPLIRESKYKSSGIFHDDVKVKYFSLPLKRIGDKVTYEYEKKYFDIKYLTKAFFHASHPQQEKKIIFDIPNWLEIELLELNFTGFDIIKTEREEKKSTIITYVLKNTEPIKNDKLSSNGSISLPHILILSKSFKFKNKSITLFNSTKDLYDWYHELTEKVENNSDQLLPHVEKIISGAKTEEEKVKKIFYWVQDNIRYIAYEDGIMGFKPASANSVYKKKYGDCKGMANLTSEMLKLAGYNAKLTWIGTRSIPYNYNTPSLAVDNHMITTLFLNNKRYYLDPTEKGIEFGKYAHRIQGQDIMIENEDSFILDTIPETPYNKNGFYAILNLELKDNLITGTGNQKYLGENKKDAYNRLSELSDKKLEEQLIYEVNKGNKNIQVENIKYPEKILREDSIHLTYDISLDNQVTELENELYINIEFDKIFSHLKIEKDRINALDFGEKVNYIKTTHLKIPITYSLEYIPEEIKIIDDEFIFDLNINFNKTNNTLTYTRKLIIKSGIIQAEKIEKWNKSIKSLNEFYNNQVILKKI